MDKEPVSFYQINFLARSMARKFKEDKITHVIGLARGGLIPATIISYELDVPLLSYSISSYDDTTKTDEFKINQFVHFTDLKSKDTDLQSLKQTEDAIEKLDKLIAVYEEDSGLISVSVLAEEPGLAADIANYISEYIVEFITERQIYQPSRPVIPASARSSGGPRRDYLGQTGQAS